MGGFLIGSSWISHDAADAGTLKAFGHELVKPSVGQWAANGEVRAATRAWPRVIRLCNTGAGTEEPQAMYWAYLQDMIQIQST